jgi:tellurite resistance protein TehA-like permease
MGGLGVLATFSGIIGVFTLGNLWKLMNVVVPNSGTVYYSISAVSMGIFGAVCAFFWQKHRDNFKNSIQQVGILIFATILSFSPWILKNSYETFTSNSPVSISALLSGIGNTFALDFSKVFDKATLKQKEDAKQFQ